MSAFQAGRGTQPAPLSPRVGQNGTAGPASLGELGRAAGPPPAGHGPTMAKSCSESEIRRIITFLGASVPCGFFWNGFDLGNIVPGTNEILVF